MRPHRGADGERALIIPDVSPNSIVRLNSGTYHVVSTYGSVNAVIRSDIRVEAGKLTEATVEHHAAELTMKLVREAGGEAIADTSWSILSGSGDPMREMVGAFASMVLAEGDYTIIAKNRDRIYQRDFTVVGGRNQDVEVLATRGQCRRRDRRRRLALQAAFMLALPRRRRTILRRRGDRQRGEPEHRFLNCCEQRLAVTERLQLAPSSTSRRFVPRWSVRTGGQTREPAATAAGRATPCRPCAPAGGRGRRAPSAG